MKLLVYLKANSNLWKKITKCVIAYEIAIILIIIPSVIPIAGTPPYLIPLGTLFFNPSGTTGNQIIGILLNIFMMGLAAIWSGLLLYLCTLYNKALQTQPNLYNNGAGIIASIGFAICVFVIAYARLKYPRLYVPALQGFTLPFFILTAGIYDTQFNVINIVSTFYPVVWGGFIALLSNLLFWPETAAKASEQAIGDSIESIKDVLSFVLQELLKNEEGGVMTTDVSASTKLQNLNNKLQKDIIFMKSARQESKYEIIVSYYSLKSYKPLLKSIELLADNLFGFSLAIKREVRIILEKKVKAHLKTTHRQSMNNTLDIFQTLSGDTLHSGREYKEIDRLQSTIQPFLKSFVSTCILTLNQIETDLIQHKAITVNKQSKPAQSNTKVDLSSAIKEFQETEKTLQNEYDVTGNIPSEEHFLVFTVIFTMVRFGKELVQLQQHTEDLIKNYNPKKPWIRRIYFPHVNIKNWLNKASNRKGDKVLSEQVILDKQELELKKKNSNIEQAIPVQSSSSITEDSHELKRRVSTLVSRIETRPELSPDEVLENSINEKEISLQHVPSKYTLGRRLYALNKWFQYGPTRYAIKFTIITVLLALMAFLPIEGANKFYNENHCQWALLSAMVVMNYTIGSTAVQCMYRIIATICGAVAGYICLLAANRNQNPYVLAVLALVFQIPMWYSLLGSPYPRIGFISILTMSVIISTGYTTENESIFEPVWKRTVTAIIATVVVMLVDQCVWPVWARKRLRTSLADLLIDTGTQYARTISLVYLDNTSSLQYQVTLEECKLHQKLLMRQLHMVQEMLVLTGDEPRLTKGPFPVQAYGTILEHERNILYWIQHIQTAQSLISKNVRKMMSPIHGYRKEMAATVHLYLFTLACALRTKSSLPGSLPSAELARRMLHTKQMSIWKENHDIETMTEHQLFWYTYAAGCTEVVIEQEAIGDIVSQLMGQHI